MSGVCTASTAGHGSVPPTEAGPRDTALLDRRPSVGGAVIDGGDRGSGGQHEFSNRPGYENRRLSPEAVQTAVLTSPPFQCRRLTS